MTLAIDLLDCLAEVGAEVEAAGGRLIVRAGAKPVPGELIQRLREAKAEILAALIPETSVGGRLTAPDADPAVWREEYNCKSFHWSLDGQRPWQEARQIAFGELLLKWHRLYGRVPDPNRCAGCGEVLPREAGRIIDSDGARVHSDAVRYLDCVTAYGERWQDAARTGLRTLGIERPSLDELTP